MQKLHVSPHIHFTIFCGICFLSLSFKKSLEELFSVVLLGEFENVFLYVLKVLCALFNFA